MGPVTLSLPRGVKTGRPRMIDFGGALVPPLGGAVQTIDRLGTRHAVDFTLPTMPSEPQGRICATDLRLAKLYGAIAPFKQSGFAIGPTGNPVVDGAGQLGSTIALRGFLPGYSMRYGQAFSLFVGGRWYLEFAAVAMRAGVDGTMELPIFPMLRKSPADGDTAAVAKPMIQGSLSGNEVAWTELTAPYCEFGTISISEDK